MEYLQQEQSIIHILKKSNTVIWKNNIVHISIAEKPIYSSGEGKTDIYCLLDTGEEIKISYKMNNADFLENKISKNRAMIIFGESWKEIITNSIKDIIPLFNQREVYYPIGKGNIKPGSYTMGWRIDIVDKPGGKQSLTTKISLTDQQKNEIFGGQNLSKDKKDAKIIDHIVENSGVANYILFESNFTEAQQILDALIPIHKYSKPLYLTFRAVNYRSLEDKIDGNRPLGVYVKWSKTNYSIVFDDPLSFGAKDILSQFKQERMI